MSKAQFLQAQKELDKKHMCVCVCVGDVCSFPYIARLAGTWVDQLLASPLWSRSLLC